MSYKINDIYKNESNKDSVNKPFMNFVAISFMGLVVIDKVKQSLVHFQNAYNFNADVWNTFVQSGIYSALKIHV